MKSKSETKREIFRDLSAYSLAHYFSEVLFLARGFLLAKMLGPPLFGLWTLVKVILFYSNAVGLGSVEAYYREGPFFRGGNQAEKTRKIEENALSFLLLVSVAAGVVVAAVGAGIRFENTLRGDILLFVAPVVLLQQLYQFSLVKMRSERRILRCSAVEGAFGLVNVALTVGLAWRYGLYGALWGVIASYALLTFYLRIGRVLDQRWRLEWSQVRELIRIGFPIMAQRFLFLLFKTVDVLMVFLLLGNSELGYYGVAFFLARGIGVLPTVLTTILFPRMMEEYGRTKDVLGMEKYVRESTAVMTGLLPLLLGPLFLLLPRLMRSLLPQFIEGIAPTRILCLAVYFLMASPMAVQALVAVNKQVLVLLLQVAAVLLNALLDFLFIRAGWGIVGVAWGTAVSYLFFGVTTTWFARGLFPDSAREKIVFCGSIVISFGYWAVLLPITEAITRVAPLAALGEAPRLALQIVLFLLLVAPFLFLWNRRTSFLRWAADILGRRSG